MFNYVVIVLLIVSIVPIGYIGYKVKSISCNMTDDSNNNLRVLISGMFSISGALLISGLGFTACAFFLTSTSDAIGVYDARTPLTSIGSFLITYAVVIVCFSIPTTLLYALISLLVVRIRKRGDGKFIAGMSATCLSTTAVIKRLWRTTQNRIRS